MFCIQLPVPTISHVEYNIIYESIITVIIAVWYSNPVINPRDEAVSLYGSLLISRINHFRGISAHATAGSRLDPLSTFYELFMSYLTVYR